MMKKIKKVKKLSGCVFLFGILFAVMFALNKMTLNRTSQGCIQLHDFYNLEDHTVDALFIGSSHVYYSVNTCMLYDDYGIAGYLLASPGQPVWISYYFLKEALKTQSPKLVVFDVCTLYQKAADVGASSWPSLISMKPSVTKWNAIRAVNREGKQLDAVGAFFSFPYYHTRYDELTRQDFYNTKRVRYNGYKPDFTKISPEELKEWEQVDRTGFAAIGTITSRTETYLRRLMELCRDQGIPLLLVNAPYVNHTLEKQQAYNYIGTIAAEYGVPFLDANYDSRIHVDDERDFFEPSHLNYRGSLKYTKYLAEVLSRYELPDRRGDTRYQHWEEVSTLFRHRETNRRALKSADHLDEYVRVLKELTNCVVTAFWNPGGEVLVYEDGKCMFAGAKGQVYLKHFDLGTSDLVVRGDGKTVQALVDQKAYSYTEQGLNILVYDKVAKRVIGGAGFAQDTTRETNPAALPYSAPLAAAIITGILRPNRHNQCSKYHKQKPDERFFTQSFLKYDIRKGNRYHNA